MEHDILQSDGKIKLAEPITEMDYATYEIMSFAEALPPKERILLLRFTHKLAALNGWCENRLKFKHDALIILSADKAK